MKRFLSLLVGGLVLLPFSVKAATSVVPTCGSADSNGNITCTIGASFDTAVDNVTVTLTEQGGATITSIDKVSNSEWLVGTPTVSGTVRTVTITHDDDTYGPASAGETSLFSFTYKVSGTENCSIQLSLDGVTVNTPAADTPTENKQTGSTVPFIALGAMVLIAGGAYVATKNKSKMFNI